MNQIQASRKISRSSGCYPDFSRLQTFKNLADAVINKFPLRSEFYGRKWLPTDYIAVLAYSWIRGLSVHDACEQMNRWANETLGFRSWTFADGRHSRGVPHQTSVNAWLRGFSLDEAQLLMRLCCEEAVKRTFLRMKFKQTVILEFDLTYIGYWGKRRDRRIKGTTMVKGAKFMRHYHGALLHSRNISLFVASEHVSKHQSKIPFMLSTVKWLQGLGVKIMHCTIDREYYRYDIIHEFKTLGVNVIVPARGSGKLTKAKENYLNGNSNRLQRYKIGNMAKAGRKTKYTRCWLVLYGRGAQHLDAIKSSYRRGILSLKEACSQIYGLITTNAPQYRSKGFFDHLKWYYKRRWQIETAFRDMDIHHGIWRTDHDGARFLGEIGRYLLLNSWYEARIMNQSKAPLRFSFHRHEMIERIANRCML